MPDTAPIKILVVDDLPEKLLVYRSVLESLDVELVLAHSGGDALRQVLQHDFAVILLDVNMPDLDGYETAALIRSRKRCAHTPIIFITAFADELHIGQFHAPRGYAYGAVDYILSPVIPDVLRTKVQVFVDLYRLNQQVRAQAERRVAVAERERAHFATLLEKATDFVGRIDASGRILSVNPAGRRMLGWSDDDPRAGAAERQLADGSPDGVEVSSVSPDAAAAQSFDALMPHFHDAFSIVRREGIWFGEATLHSGGPPGAAVPVSAVIMAHEHDGAALESFSVIARDITERKRTEAELIRHRAHLEELVRERTAELKESHEKLRLSDRLASIGTLAAGLGHDMGNLLLPIRARIATLERSDLPSAAREDVQAIKNAADYLKRLSQGLRLFALDPAEKSAGGDRGTGTNLARWWLDVQPFLRNALPKGVALEASFPPDLPALAIPGHTLTQVIYNLVQNAGDAMRGRASGTVRITAEAAREALGIQHSALSTQHILLRVADDGPGMTEEVRQRCMEPFFTTRTRRISTGLGLALVHGAIGSAGGTVEIESAVSKGTTFHIRLPTISAAAGQVEQGAQRLTACVVFDDPRLNAYIASFLGQLGVEVVAATTRAATRGDIRSIDARLLVLDSVNGCEDDVHEFVNGDAQRRALVISAPLLAAATRPHERIHRLEAPAPPSRIREALQRMIGAIKESRGSRRGDPSSQRSTIEMSESAPQPAMAQEAAT